MQNLINAARKHLDEATSHNVNQVMSDIDKLDDEDFRELLYQLHAYVGQSSNLGWVAKHLKMAATEYSKLMK